MAYNYQGTGIYKNWVRIGKGLWQNQRNGYTIHYRASYYPMTNDFYGGYHPFRGQFHSQASGWTCLNGYGRYLGWNSRFVTIADRFN